MYPDGENGQKKKKKEAKKKKKQSTLGNNLLNGKNLLISTEYYNNNLPKGYDSVCVYNARARAYESTIPEISVIDSFGNRHPGNVHTHKFCRRKNIPPGNIFS